MRVRLLGLVTLMALVLASCGGTSPESGAPDEGIQVHGDWTIDVYDQDGALDQHLEFSNALQFGGERTLNQLLGGQISPSGLWKVRFGARTASTVCPSQSSSQCVIGQVVADNGATGDGDITLDGSATIEANGVIDYVETRMGTCDDTTAPDTCTEDDNGFVFTAKDLDTADIVTVSAGQEVQIQVRISFTSG